MSQDMLKVRRAELRVKLKEKWAKLTDDDVRQFDGARSYLAGRLQLRYGIAREKAEVQVKEFERSLR